VFEALLLGPAATDTKKQLLGKLKGSWGKVALKAPGSFLVEKAFAWGVSVCGWVGWVGVWGMRGGRV